MKNNWSRNHPAVMAWEQSTAERRRQVRQRMGMRQDNRIMRKQWFGVCLLSFVIGAGLGDSGYWLMMFGVIGWTGLAITSPKGW